MRGKPVVGAICGVIALSGVLGSSAAGTTAPVNPAPTEVAPLLSDTGVAAYAGVEVWSAYDPGKRSWHLVVRRNGKLSTPAIPTAKQPIEVDVGPNATHTPTLAYVNCTHNCHVVISGLDGSARQTVPGMATGPLNAY
ncbi:MAG TPA: hypothetical protein VIJ51_03205 [Solirubrobacteraceae bacterium]